MVEGNHYFPPESLNRDYFQPSERHTVCPWKGKASYYDVAVEGKVSEGGARYYPEPSLLAKKIRGYVAFWRGGNLTRNPRACLRFAFGGR